MENDSSCGLDLGRRLGGSGGASSGRFRFGTRRGTSVPFLVRGFPLGRGGRRLRNRPARRWRGKKPVLELIGADPDRSPRPGADLDRRQDAGRDLVAHRALALAQAKGDLTDRQKLGFFEHVHCCAKFSLLG